MQQPVYLFTTKHIILETGGDKWETNVKSCGQSTHSELETVENKWNTSVNIMPLKHPHKTGNSGAQVEDKWKTSVKSQW